MIPRLFSPQVRRPAAEAVRGRRHRAPVRGPNPLRTVAAVLLVGTLVFLAAHGHAQEAAEESAPGISISQEIGDVMAREAARVRADLEQQARSLFRREPLGWGWDTLAAIYRWLLDTPEHLARFIRIVVEHGRVLGAVGSLVMLTFLAAVLYSLMGQRRILRRIEDRAEPYRERIPEAVFPFLLSAVRIVVAALIPLLLLGGYSLVSAMIRYRAPWFTILGHLLVIWTAGSLLMGLFRETLTRDLFRATREYGPGVYRLVRLVLFYALAGIALIWCAAGLNLRPDVLAFFQFVISLSIVVVLFLLHLKKKALLSFLPDLPYGSYRSFLRLIHRYYFPIIFVALTAALLWCVGYRNLGRVVIFKIVTSIVAYLAIMTAYHLIRRLMHSWKSRMAAKDEAGRLLVDSLQSLLLYAAILGTVLVVLNLLGLLPYLQRIMSFPVFTVGDTALTLWTLLSAAALLLAFIFSARLLQAYLDYKIYPRLGINQGLGYMLNTLIKYASFGIGLLISLRIVGIDLRFLLVFAGALGIGVGLGLQNLAANIISGFTIIFGGKVRKGDWIETGDTLGEVTDIFLRATKIRTRDNVEYLVPNSDIISNTIVNYSLSSPMIRLDLDVGVSYDADPRQVEEILVDAAKKEPLVARYRRPEVRFVAYGDNSINFQLLFWIDVRTTARRRVRSALYFTIFDALKAAGIEIPFPQRDLHIRDLPGGAPMAPSVLPPLVETAEKEA